jgi:hypothetical protein
MLQLMNSDSSDWSIPLDTLLRTTVSLNTLLRDNACAEKSIY